MSKQFSARLRKAIDAMGLKATHFAHKAGIPQGTISKCLHGHVPSAKLLVRICKISGKSVDWLLTGKEKRSLGGGYVAERPARYGRPGGARKSQAGEEVWVAKLRKVLRSGDQPKMQKIKSLLDDLSL